MAAILECDIETLGKRLTTGLEAGLEKAIHDELIKQADVIVTKLAKEMAKNLRGRITSYKDYAGDRVNVVLVLDGVSDLPNVLTPNAKSTGVPPTDATKGG